MAECPKCGAKVKKDNLRRHISGVHGPSAQAPKAAPPAPGRPASTVAFPWQIMVVLGVVAAVVIAGYWYMTQQPIEGPPSSGKVAVIEVENFGTIKIQLNTARAPNTAANFIGLATAARYDSNQFHRVVAGFVIQGGAVGGASNVAWESTGLKNVRYSIAMARSGSADNEADKDTATSQFFINLQDNPNLDTRSPSNLKGVTYAYVVFGLVTEGQSVVDAISQVPTNGEEPTTPVRITSIRIQS